MHRRCGRLSHSRRAGWKPTYRRAVSVDGPVIAGCGSASRRAETLGRTPTGRPLVELLEGLSDLRASARSGKTAGYSAVS